MYLVCELRGGTDLSITRSSLSRSFCLSYVPLFVYLTVVSLSLCLLWYLQVEFVIWYVTLAIELMVISLVAGVMKEYKQDDPPLFYAPSRIKKVIRWVLRGFRSKSPI